MLEIGTRIINGRYQLTDFVGSGASGEVYVGRDLEDESRPLVAIKRFNIGSVSPGNTDSLRELHRECLALTQVGDAAIVKIHNLHVEGDSIVIIEEFLAGGNLEDAVSHAVNSRDKQSAMGGLPAVDIARIGLTLARGLSAIHGRGVFHGDVKPTNVGFRDKEHSQPVLLDFGLAEFTDSIGLLENGGSKRATLAYLAPEVSGFLGEVEGVLCDLYSLGVTLYQCAVGEVPFADKDPKVTIRRILTEVPPPIFTVVPGFPEALSDVIGKLMRKQPSERYHTAVGLMADLDFCLQSLTRGDVPRVFALGRKDKIRELNYRIPMVGRREEIDRLRGELNKATSGRGGLVFIAAPSGTGKSRLSLEFAAEARNAGMGILFTKFSEFERNLPFSAIHSLVHEFTNTLSRLSASELTSWKQRIHSRLQGRGRLLTERFTELGRYLPEFPPLPRMEHEEMSRVFIETMAEFLTLLDHDATGQLVVLDDLQWADMSSLEIVDGLLTLAAERGLANTLIIGTYRSNEVGDSHPLMVRVLTKTVNEQRIELGPLTQAESKTLIEHVIDERGTEVDKLTDFTFRLAEGNPFFSYECLKSLISSETFALQDDGSWTFDEEKQRETTVSVGMAELVSGRIRKLPRLEREVLVVASIIGSKFRLSLLSRVIVQEVLERELGGSVDELEQYRAETPEVITRLVQSHLEAQHLILADSVNFVFFHDKVREAAIALASEELKRRVHQICGEYLASECIDLEDKGGAPSQQLYDAAFHLMRGSPSDTKSLARRTLYAAAKRAVQVFAFQKALDYLEAAAVLFEIDATTGLRDEDKGEWVAINELLGDALGLSRRVDEAIALLEVVYELVDDPLHKAEICAKRIDYNLALFRYQECIRAGKEGLSQVGYQPYDSVLSAIFAILLWTPWIGILFLWFRYIGKRKKRELSPQDVIRLKLMIAYQVPTYFSRPIIAIAQQYPLTRELMSYEDNPFRVMTVAYWGIVTATIGLSRISHRCFSSALSYFDKNPNPVYQGFVLFCWGYLLDFPMGNLVEAQKKEEKAYEILSGVGESFWQLLSLMAMTHLDRFGLGNGQSSVAGAKLTGLWEQVGFEPMALGANLIGLLYEGRSDEVTKWMQIVRDGGDRVESRGFETIDLIYSCLFPGEILLHTGEVDRAIVLLDKALFLALRNLHRVAASSFSASVVACAYIRAGRPRKAIFPLMIAYLNPLVAVTVFNPQMFYVTGEFLMKIGLFSLGRRVFEKGIRYARVRGWKPIAAEGWLTLGEILVGCDPDRAEDYLAKSLEYFKERGSDFLAERARNALQIAQANLVSLTPAVLPGKDPFKTTSYTVRHEVETSALLEIFLNLSSLTQIDAILDAVLDALCRCTGAEIGIIFSQQDGAWVPSRSLGIEHESLIGGHFGMCGVDKSFFDHCVSLAIVEARVRPAVGHSHELKGSVLVLPLAYKGRVSGMCYLGSRNISDLFDNTAIQTISPIAAQAAIALQNVDLLAETERKAREISEQTDRLNHLVSVGHAVAGQIEISALSSMLTESFRGLFGEAVCVRILIHASCHSDSDTGANHDVYYRLLDDGSYDLDVEFSPEELTESRASFAVADPRGESNLAYICVDHCVAEELERLRPTIEAICTNVASALTTVRLEQVFGLVKDRTRDIRTIFENINQGVCMVDAGMYVGKELSRQMTELYGDSVAGESIVKVFEKTSLTVDQRQMVYSALNAALNSHICAFEVNEDILPRQGGIRENEAERLVEFDWTPIVDGNDVTRRVMLTTRDVTEFARLRAEATQAAHEAGCFREVFGVSPAKIKNFLEDLDSYLETVRAAMRDRTVLDGESMARWKRDLHTLKGTSRLLKLSGLTDTIHELESSLIEVFTREMTEATPVPESLGPLVEALAARSCDYHKVELTLKGWSLSHGGDPLEIPAARCFAVLAEVEKNVNDSALHSLVHRAKGCLMELQSPSLQSVVEGIYSVACDIAEKELGKPRPTLHCDMDQTWLLGTAAAKTVSESLNHIFRNMVDHGFAADEVGVIYARGSLREGDLLLEVWSSEEGLNLQALERKFQAHVGESHHTPSDEEIAETIFLSGLSTAERVSQISGRGIGMDAVRTMLTELGGSICIEFRDARNQNGRRPFLFQIVLPRNIIEFEYENEKQRESVVEEPMRQYA